MSELYAFLFCLALGMAARPLFIGASALSRRVNLIPVTVTLDFAFVMTVGAAFTAYVILSGAIIAPYMFAALGAGYYLVYLPTRRRRI